MEARLQSRWGHWCLRACAAAVLALSLSMGYALPVTADAALPVPTPANLAATHAYFLAMSTFEEAQLATLAQDTVAMEAAAAQVSGECPGILTDAPPHERVFGFGLVGPTSRAAPNARAEGERSRQSRQLGDLKLELFLALAGSRTQGDREATIALIHALTPLRWSSPQITFLVHLTLESLQEELDLPMPPACADMRAWVASGYKTLSPASKELASRTEALLRRSFELVAVATQTPIQPLPKALAPYESAADKKLARHTEALAAQLRKENAQADILKRLEGTIGLPAEKPSKIKRPARKPVVVARRRTAAGGSFVAKAERSSHAPDGVCSAFVTIEEPSHPHAGLLETLSGEGTDRCLSRSHVQPNLAVHCNAGLLTVEANLLPTTRSVRLLLSDGHTITSMAIRVSARLGGPAGLYYQVVRGPSPIPVSLTELDAQDRTLTVLKLPAVVECAQHPVKYFPGGIVTLAHESLPQGPSFTIRGERYRKLGAVHFELKLKVSNEEELYGNGGGGLVELRVEEGASARSRRVFEPKTSSGCQPQPYVIIYGLLKAPRDTVFVRVSGTLVPLRTVTIPARLHADGTLTYGAFSPIPTELLIRDENGKTVSRQDLGEAAKSNTETCEGEAEGS